MKNSKIKPTYICIAVLCAIMLIFEFFPVCKALKITSDAAYNRLLCLIFPLIAGCLAVWLISRESGLKLFQRPQNLWVLIPAIIIALDNFPWLAYFAGKMELVHTQPLHFTLFSVYCLAVGFFEEVLFRGVFFALILGVFERTRKGFLYAYVLSSVVFGLVHLLNVFTAGGGAVLQAGYSILTGGLFAFVFIKTKNIVFPAIIHAIYNFCGLLFTKEVGLGLGSVLDLPTGIMMAIVSIIVGAFVLYKVWRYSDDERAELYRRLGIAGKRDA